MANAKLKLKRDRTYEYPVTHRILGGAGVPLTGKAFCLGLRYKGDEQDFLVLKTSEAPTTLASSLVYTDQSAGEMLLTITDEETKAMQAASGTYSIWIETNGKKIPRGGGVLEITD